MRKGYKSLRDKYKADAEHLRGDLVRKQMVLDDISRQLKEKTDLMNKQAEEKKKRWSTTLYCTNCQVVSNVSCPQGCNIKSSNCVHCGVISSPIAPTLFTVIDYPGK